MKQPKKPTKRQSKAKKPVEKTAEQTATKQESDVAEWDFFMQPHGGWTK